MTGEKYQLGSSPLAPDPAGFTIQIDEFHIRFTQIIAPALMRMFFRPIIRCPLFRRHYSAAMSAPGVARSAIGMGLGHQWSSQSSHKSASWGITCSA